MSWPITPPPGNLQADLWVTRRETEGALIALDPDEIDKIVP